MPEILELVSCQLFKNEWSFTTTFDPFVSALSNNSRIRNISQRSSYYYLKEKKLLDEYLEETEELNILYSDHLSVFEQYFWKMALNSIKWKGHQQNLEMSNFSNVTHSRLENAIKIIDKYSEKSLQLIKNYSPNIVVLSLSDFISTSIPKFYGTIFINVDRIEEIEEVSLTLIHELAHQELFLLNTYDQLICSKHKKSLQYAQFQGLHRPPIARLHACHAIFRMYQFSLSFDCIFSDALKRDFIASIDDINCEELTSFAKKSLLDMYQKFL